jgi:hypothetical protein
MAMAASIVDENGRIITPTSTLLKATCSKKLAGHDT